MCGRFDQDRSNAALDALAAMLAPGSPGDEPRETVFPGSPALVLEGVGQPHAMVWGFPKGAGKAVIFNARCEGALEKPLFRSGLLSHPLAVPVTAFYEWQGERGQKRQYRFQAPGGALLYLAAFCRAFEAGWRFTVLTRAADAFMAPYHHRMPLLVAESQLGAWLTPGAAAPLSQWLGPGSPPLIAQLAPGPQRLPL